MTWVFCLLAAKKAIWVTSNITEVFQENLAKVLFFAVSAQIKMVWSGNMASNVPPVFPPVCDIIFIKLD